MDGLVRAALAGLACREIYLRVVRPGRTSYVVVHALLADAEAGLDVRRADGYRRAIIDALASRQAPVVVGVVFTAVDEFAAPTTGFVTRPAEA
jgi:predicted Co/Zn/Cd cation transporter (cation efflux family)